MASFEYSSSSINKPSSIYDDDGTNHLPLTEHNLTQFNNQFPPHKSTRKENALSFAKEQSPIVELEKSLREEQERDRPIQLSGYTSEKILIVKDKKPKRRKWLLFKGIKITCFTNDRYLCCLPSISKTIENDELIAFKYPDTTYR
ncbi:unnamed protein product [Rhizopus stolonifer]